MHSKYRRSSILTAQVVTIVVASPQTKVTLKAMSWRGLRSARPRRVTSARCKNCPGKNLP